MGSSSADEELPSAATLTVKACHELKIDVHSRISDTAGWPCFSSCPFRAGGYTWKIHYWPKGQRSYKSIPFLCRLINAKFSSIYLVLVDEVSEAVKAQTWGFGHRRFIKREDLARSPYLKDDCFIVRVDFCIVKEAVLTPCDDDMQHLGDILSREDGTNDIEFHVSGETFVAHRLVLAAWSSVFRALLFGPTAANNNVIRIDDMDAHVFRALLVYIYTDALPADLEQEDERAMAERLLVAADKYKLQRLKTICEDRLCNHISTSSAATILELSELHQCPGLKKACFEFIDSSTVLFAIIETREFEHLARSCPAITKELISNVIGRNMEKASLFECTGESSHVISIIKTSA
ncbi:hypothetical protein PR202_ga18612 [Eleusine coracana subsp. coracana]|uniref:Uncharacterized protein n=1 Tax=Eleusine coracana subsp. coracana TaxID=191504 RepID=A0AAV5CTA4_ELECO|nr:hypothetical protein PR202_ga18612 [Eleusine coracana subsp. coracana]